jgi:TrmH family RNA methyltransferase
MTTITSTTNQKVKWIRRLQSQRSARQEEGRFVIEGGRMLHEALIADVQVSLVLYSEAPDAETRRLLDEFVAAGVEVIPASAEVIDLCSDTEAPQGLLAVISLPQKSYSEAGEPLLIVDRLRDPGNLGTLMRSALAAHFSLMLLTPGTVDPLNPKVVRGAMGAHFYLPAKRIDFDGINPYLQGKTLWVAEANRGLRYDQIDWTQPSALLIGGEAQGPSAEMLKLEHNYVHIPINASAESLNAAVAGSVLMFEIARQRGFK